MNEKLQALEQELSKLAIPHKIVNLGGPAVRTRDVLAQKDLDVDPEAVVKTIMFKSKKHGPFAVSVLGKDRIDYKKLKEHFQDKKISTLRPEEMRELGWEPGECCPLNMNTPLIVDPSVFEFERINTGSGDLEYGIEFPPSAIHKLKPKAKTLDVIE